MQIAAEILTLKNCPYFRVHQELISDHSSLYSFSNEGFASIPRSWRQTKELHPELDDFLEKNKDLLARYQDELVRWENHFGIFTTTPFDQNFPLLLRKMKSRPWLLFYKGSEIWKEAGFLSVVGSRDMTSETAEWIELELMSFLRASGAGIVSGGARGVDLKSHQAALKAQCPTVAFLPSGLQQMYPADFASCAQMILDKGGALISEYEPMVEMRKQYFIARNRLIASMGIATLIVQAHVRSGTMLTAQHAVNEGRSVFVVPGHPQSPKYSGNLKLLNEGATLLCGAQELIMYYKSESLVDLSSHTRFSSFEDRNLPI